MSDNAIARYKLKSGNILKVIPDENAESPREWDNLSVMVCFHGRYTLGDKTDYRSGDYNSWEELEQAITKKEKPVTILPLYLYDHSGLRMKVGSFQGLLPQGHAEFDSGQVGFIFVRRADALENYSVKRISPALRKRIEDLLRSEVEEYDQYLRGDVYGFKVVKTSTCSECGDEDEEEIDSCWGFYGDDPKENGMLENIGDEIVEEL